MGAVGSRLFKHTSRRLRCCVSFGLFGWALVVLSENGDGDGDGDGDPSSSLYYRGLLSCALCGLFGWSLAKLSERGGGDPYGSEGVSTQPPPAPVAYCSICMESKPLSETFGMKLCSHFFCSACVGGYVAVKVAENATSIRCPDPGCKDGFLEPEMCRPILAPDVLDRWGRALCESVIKFKFYCPFKDCSAVLVDERAGNIMAITESECPHCHRLFCAKCEVPWHAGVTCKEYRKLGADERGKDDLLLLEMAKTRKWQRCPKCRIHVERTEGCMFMKCRCGFRFCYGCASEMIKDHYCAKCKR